MVSREACHRNPSYKRLWLAVAVSKRPVSYVRLRCERSVLQFLGDLNWPNQAYFMGLILFACMLNVSFVAQVNVPKTRRTYCKKCKKHQPHKVTQYKKGKDSLYAQGDD